MDITKHPKLPAPKLSSASNTATGVKVTWEKVSGAAKYRVYYKGGDAKSWTQIKDVTGTSYTWKDAKSCTKYSFTVKAYDKNGKAGSYDKTGKSITYYAAPKVTISIAANGIKVTWNAVKGSPRYMVYYRENGGAWHKIGTTTATSYTRKAANLKTGVAYQFTVRCVKNDKKTMLSSYAASNSLKYLSAPKVTISAAANGIKVTWNAVSGASRYMVYYRENGGSWKKIGTTTATSYTRAVKYLKAGVTYQFTVRCVMNDKKTMLSAYAASNSLKYKK